jgi:uncharacterized protein YjbI with pentapeptide repeats
MNESKPQAENHKDQSRLSQEQYDMLRRCADKKDITEWNEWRKKNPNVTIFLDGRNFHGCDLSGAFLNTGAVVINPGTSMHEQYIFKGQVHLRNSLFLQATLHRTDFRGAHIEGANFNSAKLEGGCLELAYMQSANLKGAMFNKSTSFEGCYINKQTDFRESDLTNLRVSPQIKQLMEYNIRRMNWEDWYQKHPFLKWPIRWFWCVSDYGISTWRIIGWFIGLSLFFAAIYSSMAFWSPPGIVSYLEVEPHLPLWHYFILLLIRPVYFSVVTMTTLGFGDMYANSQSICGHISLTIQVILGYVLLGALVTRFAVLFTAGGPAGRFADDNDNKKISY